jgi:hypothetical protein
MRCNRWNMLHSADIRLQECDVLYHRRIDDIGVFWNHMIILVCGGRNFGDLTTLQRNFPFNYREHPMWPRREAEYRFVQRTLDFAAIEFSKYYHPEDNWLPSDLKIISGAATGADSVAIDWAVCNLSSFGEYPANWEKFGRIAGFIRNQEMLDKESPNIVIAFPGHAGTADMIRRARKAKIEVRKMSYQSAITMNGEKHAGTEF